MKVDISTPSNRRAVRRTLATLLAALMMTTVGLAASPTEAEASHNNCYRLGCAGKWPGKQDCTPGTTLGEPNWRVYGRSASVHLKHGGHCSARWARLVWDGPTERPLRFQIKVARQERNGAGDWVVTDRVYRTIKNGPRNSTAGGSYVSRMIPSYSTGKAKRYRACARFKRYTYDHWDPYASWRCTPWVST